MMLRMFLLAFALTSSSIGFGQTYTDNNDKVAQNLAAKFGRSITSATFVAKQNPAIHKRFDEYATRLTMSPEQKDRVMLTTHLRASFGTIAAVGTDYVLVEMDGDQEGKRVIPKSSIGAIHLESSPVRFLHPPTSSRKSKD
ncbi:hypothetical protein K227x_06390 [Rubripirellula lacrimiformis]|uniref:Uncharacterized protein n=1 Tax=Rubripirellula lacrimiformis TaxID=1930273 RepID=A0A517N551_9BACT|nr:hypothetical protein [Rubripirellula lacrimiformis]QDT02266.1 hypothetical protein K227x_06390 [Rubripirellula lacrimiformis]